MSSLIHRHPARFALATATATALIVAAACSQAPLASPDGPPPRIITVSASGDSRAAPDIAMISAGVVTQAKTAAEAMAANAERMTALFAAIEKAGVEKKDLQTTSFSVSPQYPPYDSPQPRTIQGYEVSNQVTMTVRDLAKLGPSLDAFVTAGANQINSISFAIDDPKGAEAKAREAAVKAAEAKARTIAAAAGVELGRVLTVSEGGGYMPMPQFDMRVAAAPAAPPPPTPIATGEQVVSVSVTVTYEIR